MSVSESPVPFLDTSALVKRYHPERGSDTVRRLFADPSAACLITDIGIIEWHSAFARRVRMGEITVEDYQAAKAELDADIRSGRLRVEPLRDADKASAAQLLERYALTRELRTLDALHLAVVVRLGPARLRAVYCADQNLCVVLEAEGLPVINPEREA